MAQQSRPIHSPYRPRLQGGIFGRLLTKLELHYRWLHLPISSITLILSTQRHSFWRRIAEMAAGHNNSAQQLSQPTVTVTPEVLVSQQVTPTPVRNKHIPLPRTSIPVTSSPATPTLPFTPPNPNDILASPQQIDSSLQRGIAPSQDDPSLQRGHDTHSPESLLDLTAEDDDGGDVQMTPISARQRRALRSISDFNSKGYTETPISTGVRTYTQTIANCSRSARTRRPDAKYRQE